MYAAAPGETAASAARGLESSVPGVKVVLADTLQAIEGELAAGTCGLLITEYAPPLFDAMAVLHTRDELSPETPVLVLTGELPEKRCLELLRQGADDFISGAAADRLAHAVQAALARSARRLAADRAAAASRMDALGRLAGGVAHDFNNILGAIEGYSTLNLRRLSPDDPLREDLGEIRKAVARAAALNRQLLMFSRTFPVRARPVPLNGLMDSLRQVLAEKAPGLNLEVEVPEGLPPAGGDQAELGQALVNLVLNAREANPDGVVRIKAAALPLRMADVPAPDLPLAPVYLKISVADNGPGVPRKILGTVFDPFFTTRDKGKRAGLGLSEVYGIVRRHRGWIEIDSSASGSEFSVLLPAFKKSPEPEAAATCRAAGPSGASGLVLIIEDDAELLSIAGKGLRAAGYETVMAENMAESLALLRDRGREVKIIFADIALPDGRTTDRAEEMARLAPGACLIFVSGHDQREAVMRISGGRPFRFLQKPYSIDDLLSLVADCFMN